MREGTENSKDLSQGILYHKFIASEQDFLSQNIIPKRTHASKACNSDHTDSIDNPVKQTKTNKQGNKGKILLMDDNIHIVNVLTSILRTMGYTVIDVREGDSAIEQYTLAKNEGAPFDICIIDFIIKGGRGGESTMTELISIDPEVKAIISTGYSSDPIITDYRRYGFIDYLKKPYKIEEFLAKIEKHVKLAL